ncbi:hypothetical protein [Mesorhizobium sp.]|uniref:hypothetical protein n=1 Tax=Mesorhizobium sp. TaxID=1871066 RepID=UPI0034260C13
MRRRGDLAGAQHAKRRARPSGRRHIVETLENRRSCSHARFIQKLRGAVHFVPCQAPLRLLSRGRRGRHSVAWTRSSQGPRGASRH